MKPSETKSSDGKPQAEPKTEDKPQEASQEARAKTDDKAPDALDAIARAEADGVPLSDILGDDGALQFAESNDPGMQAELEKWQKEANEWKDKALRAIAEEENTRARLERERGDLLKFAQAPLAMEIFEVTDTLGRAIKSLEAEAQKSEEFAGVLSGLQLTEQKMLDALQKHHIRKFAEVGDKFDAALHQAVSMVDKAGTEPNSIVEVLQSGYILHDRVLRAAMVIVTKA